MILPRLSGAPRYRYIYLFRCSHPSICSFPRARTMSSVPLPESARSQSIIPDPILPEFSLEQLFNPALSRLVQSTPAGRSLVSGQSQQLVQNQHHEDSDVRSLSQPPPRPLGHRSSYSEMHPNSQSRQNWRDSLGHYFPAARHETLVLFLILPTTAAKSPWIRRTSR